MALGLCITAPPAHVDPTSTHTPGKLRSNTKLRRGHPYIKHPIFPSTSLRTLRFPGNPLRSPPPPPPPPVPAAPPAGKRRVASTAGAGARYLQEQKARGPRCPRARSPTSRAPGAAPLRRHRRRRRRGKRPRRPDRPQAAVLLLVPARLPRKSSLLVPLCQQRRQRERALRRGRATEGRWPRCRPPGLRKPPGSPSRGRSWPRKGRVVLLEEERWVERAPRDGY